MRTSQITFLAYVISCYLKVEIKLLSAFAKEFRNTEFNCCNECYNPLAGT